MFGPNIHNAARVDNILPDTLSILSSTSVDKYKLITTKAQCCANRLFPIFSDENNEDFFLINILNVQREQNNYLRKLNSKLSAYILDRVSGYSKQVLNNSKIICYYRKIYVPQSLHRCVLDWHHFYINYTGESILEKQSGVYTTGNPLS